MQLGIGVLVGLVAGLLVAVLGLRLFIGRRLRAARDEQARLTDEAQRSGEARKAHAAGRILDFISTSRGHFCRSTSAAPVRAVRLRP